MSLIKFPDGQNIFTGKAFQEDIWKETDELLSQGNCPAGWLAVETKDARLICLFHQSKTYLAGLCEPDGFSWIPLHEFPLRVAQLDKPVCSMMRADLVMVLLLAVHLRTKPDLQATTDLVDLAFVLKSLASYGQDAALALERNRRRTLLFLQRGKPARAYFAEPGAGDDRQTDVAKKFLDYAFAPGAPVTRIEVFRRLAIENDPDAGKSLSELATEASPAPATNIQVMLSNRIVMQRPFMSPSMRIGRHRSCEIILDNLSVSRIHAEIIWERGRFLVVDLDSANGTTVNSKLTKRQEIQKVDIVGIGKFQLTLVDPPDIRVPDPTMLLQPGQSMNHGSDTPILFLVGDEQWLSLKGETTIGKAQGVDVTARGFRVKSLHARITLEGNNNFKIRSTSGCYVRLNGEKTSQAYLKSGDELVIGRSRFKLSSKPRSEPTNT